MWWIYLSGTRVPLDRWMVYKMFTRENPIENGWSYASHNLGHLHLPVSSAGPHQSRMRNSWTFWSTRCSGELRTFCEKRVNFRTEQWWKMSNTWWFRANSFMKHGQRMVKPWQNDEWWIMIGDLGHDDEPYSENGGLTINNGVYTYLSIYLSVCMSVYLSTYLST